MTPFNMFGNTLGKMTRAVNGFSGFMGAPSLKAMGGTMAGAYNIGRKAGFRSTAFRDAASGLGGRMGRWATAGGFKGSAMGRYARAGARIGAAGAIGMAGADFLNPFGVGWND